MSRKFPFLHDYRPRQGAEGGFFLDDKDGIPSDLKGFAGVYIIEAGKRFKFPYPTGQSGVIYIGKADDLRSRLQDHRCILAQLQKDEDYGMAPNEPWVSSRYQYMLKYRARVYFFRCRRQQEAKEEESKIMWSFYKKYRALPVGSGAKSYS